MAPTFSKYSYQRKTSRGSWDETAMSQAIEKVRAKEITLREAATNYNIPKSTLARRVVNSNKIATETKKHLGRFTRAFSDEEEKEITDHILLMESRFFGLSCTDVRKLAFEFAEAKEIPHKFNKEKGMASKKWLYNFLSRQKNISLRTPEATSFARASSFNKPVVEKFFKMIDAAYMKYNLSPDRLYNVDESSMKTVQGLGKVLGTKGKKQIGGLTSAERGRNTTIICAMSAEGHFIPPAFIFPRKRRNEEMCNGAPTGSIAFFQENGWSNSDIFLEYLKFFHDKVKPSSEKPVMIILDGHASHTKSLNVIEFARNSHIILVSLPPHTTHKLQPLDVSFFGPLNSYYNQAITVWLREHPGRIFNEFQVAKAVGYAFGRAAVACNASNGFRKCGLWPLNPNVFEEHEFAPSLTTDRPCLENSTLHPNDEDTNTLNKPSSSRRSEQKEETSSSAFTPSDHIHSSIECRPKVVSIQHVSPIPVVTGNNSQRRKRMTTAAILTESPYKNALAERKVLPSSKKNLFSTSKKGKLTPGLQVKSKKMRKETVSDSICKVCEGEFKHSNDDWLKCKTCNEWAHESCGLCDKLYFYCFKCDK